MQTKVRTLRTIFSAHRLMRATAAFGLLLVFGFAQTGLAQTNQLNLFNNYFVTGDYVVGGVGLRGLGNATGFATGTITIPDPKQPNSTSVPAGADIVAAFLYWQTVESSKLVFAGQQGFFNGYAITGTILGNPNAPTSWSSGGCSGSSQGSKTLRTYRADVRPFLPVDSNGKIQANASYQVKLADSGSSGGGTPLTLGATLVMIHRVLSPAVPLNAVILYEGAFAPSNASSTMSQQMVGFYQPAASPVAKITHIVGNGQANKSESVFLNSVNLPSLYGTLPPFPGIYNDSWDNPTWSVGGLVNGFVPGFDTSETTSVVPAATNSGCVSWGAVIFSTTVQDTDGDGLLDVWEDNQGYTDAKSGQFVALPGANKSVRDIFAEIDYLRNLDGSAGPSLHSHLPKQAALDMVGNTFAAKNVHVHFDVGNVYQTAMPGGPSVPCGSAQCDPYIVPAGTGGNAIPESAVICNDSTTLCAFPGQAAVSWKGGFLFVKNNATLPNNTNVSLGNFQLGRKDSYHYVLFGHALGEPRSFWSTFGATTSSNTVAKLISITNSGITATVTIQSPSGVLKPGDPVNQGDPAFGDVNLDRIAITGALGQRTLNGVYKFTNVNSSAPDANNLITTTFNITTSNVASAAYDFTNEPHLGIGYAGPTSSSGHSDLGGADSAVTFGLWPADDPPGCQPDPSVSAQTYCINQVGTITAEAGTLLHELGHTLTLTHGGTYYANADNNPPGPPSYGLNCSPSFLSSMNYLFQIRGFPGPVVGDIGYSGQIFLPLDETNLNESTGIGNDSMGQAALHFTRWYAPPNALDTLLQNTVGGRFATRHCNGSPIGANEPPAVRVDGSTFSASIDWNNDLFVPDAVSPQDVNFNGITGDSPFRGFNDWAPGVTPITPPLFGLGIDPRQVGARRSVNGSSGGADLPGGGADLPGGGADLPGGGADLPGGGADLPGGGADLPGGGTEQDADTANSTADAPTGLTAVLGSKSVVLNWTAPGFGQVRRYAIWRATGSFPTLASVVANQALFTNIGMVSGAPPPTTFTDTTVKNNTTYTYFVTDTNKQKVQSGASAPATIFVKFSP